MQTGQNSIAPENSLPQLGQVRTGSVFIGLLRMKVEGALRRLAYQGVRILCLLLFMEASPVDRIQEVVLERSKQKRLNTGVGRGKEI